MRKHILFILLVSLCCGLPAQSRPTIYDEDNVPAYTLPDPLICNDGTKVTTVKQWENQRRPEIMELFASQEYGRTPEERIDVTYETLSEDPTFLNGKATAWQVKFTFTNGRKSIDAVLLLVLPNSQTGKAPVFISYNFKSNQGTRPDASIDAVIERGYGAATLSYQDIYPDKPGMEEQSVVSLFASYTATKQSPDRWQALGVWAWGLSRIADYLETQERVDANKLIVMGHSRLGKATLWAGAQDKRFSLVISNNSGCGGAALSKRAYGETVGKITNAFPHWFCPSFANYSDKEADMPFDQHELIALIAPRPVYIASAEDDKWADPRGEYLAGYYAGPVYELYKLKGLDSDSPPAVNHPVMNTIGYHIRSGGHDVTSYDWMRFMDFADSHL
ncbi:MAG: acetylxylan esterase [Tannerellaceae bacterium]|nr:acetylxylan esterase [Tannerellaceae bacterium]